MLQASGPGSISEDDLWNQVDSGVPPVVRQGQEQARPERCDWRARRARAGVPGAKGDRREEGYLPFVVGGCGRRQGWDPGEKGSWRPCRYAFGQELLMTSRCCANCNGHARCKSHVCDAACMHACSVISLCCHQDETRHRPCNVFDERAISV